MTTIEIQTENEQFNIELTGTQDNPIITAEKHTFRNGTCIHGKARLQHWKGLQQGIYIRDNDVYVQCPESVKKIKEEILKLPIEKKFARKELEKITSDGSITVEKWNFDCPMWDSNGEFISDDEMERFLDKQGVKEIKIEEAVKLYENRPLEKREEKYNAQFQFETDEIEERYIQACENAGIPTHLR